MSIKFEVGDEVLIRGVLENNVTAHITNYPLKLVIKGDHIGTFTEDGQICYSSGPILELVKKGKLPFGQVRRHREEASKYQAFVFQDTGEDVFYKIMYAESGKEVPVVREKMDFLETYPEIVERQK